MTPVTRADGSPAAAAALARLNDALDFEANEHHAEALRAVNVDGHVAVLVKYPIDRPDHGPYIPIGPTPTDHAVVPRPSRCALPLSSHGAGGEAR